ncbi:MAG: glycoside hydrolase TIM-barrel-like domain-containing protein [Pseudomonadota bacterium]|nr:glycoside hydrolase TIM-barrel-like domain-containing protein [Pseudomonadota bacterium]MEE3098843.1 glycoside hydrolase TIM-barrel-like domain-containing protein [Pseudomonadota bacterium]
MATLVLAAAGTALGTAAGGSILGIGAAAIGQAAGAVLGAVIDQNILGGGSGAVARGRASGLKVQAANEGAPIPRVYGRMRVAGQLIWSTRFREHVTENGGGKGGPKVRDYSYTISFAVALCEGPITRIGRMWFDGKQVNVDAIQWRLHRGTETQGPDSAIEAAEGEAPGFRGVAYLVFEDLPVADYGNRIPQVSVEVFRRPRSPKNVEVGEEGDLRIHKIVKAVAMSPGSGEFVLETDPIRVIEGEGQERFANLNAWSDRTDAVAALDQLVEELPNLEAVSLVVSWFGDDLRCGECRLRPGAEYAETVTAPHVWQVAGRTRDTAYLVSRDEEDRPIFGGTPSDGSVIRYIRELKARGIRVTFYPFILMDVPGGNGKPDPWGWGAEQAAFPWRGRITTSAAPGRPGSPDVTAAAADEVADFFGTAEPEEFAASGDTILYSGGSDWRMRRFILHYAHLCALAGGVDAFCIGSEMRSLTQIRSARTEFPAVDELIRLTKDVRGILGDGVKLGYAADWSEYFGYQPADGTGDRLFNLDPLWAHRQIDFVGIDWYAPLTDWRDGRAHLDAQEASTIYDLDYLASRFSAGEGFDWYYASDADRLAQVRTPIVDGLHGEHWIWRNKDLKNWWSRSHYQRVDGAREDDRTAWRPRSKPIWLTEIGCSSVDKGTNQPNVFVDPKSSEHGYPHFSSGLRDDLIQRRMLQAAQKHWGRSVNNPDSTRYTGTMLDLSNSYVWTWDARPWPEFPRRLDLWSDGENYEYGHWLNGRVTAGALDRIVAEICDEAGLVDIDVTGLHALVDGFLQDKVQTPREALQALMIAEGFDAYESQGVLRFVMRGQQSAVQLAPEEVVAEGAGPERDVERVRAPESTVLREVRVGFLRTDAGYQAGAAEVINPDGAALGVQGADLPIAMSRGRAVAIAERWARESAVARETLSFGLPNARLAIEPGDVVRFGPEGDPEYRIDRIAEGHFRRMEATRIEAANYQLGARVFPNEPEAALDARTSSGAPGYRLLDVPWAIFDGSETRGYVATWSSPWPGTVAVYGSDRDERYAALGAANRPSVVGQLLGTLEKRAPWRWTRGLEVQVRMLSGALSSADELAVYNGANLAALSSPLGGWELVQFRNAELVATNTYRLSGFLRGLGGTETLIGDPTPSGSMLVLLDNRLVGLNLGQAAVDVSRHYRIGPQSADIGDSSFAHAVWTWEGAPLKPHAPTMLRAERAGGGDVTVTWIRRGRRDADTWPAGETPLFEETERYRVRVRAPGGSVVRSAEVTSPSFVYTAAQQAGDGIGAVATFEIAQISAAVGPGHDGKVTIDG